jgi:hypothetical protein
MMKERERLGDTFVTITGVTLERPSAWCLYNAPAPHTFAVTVDILTAEE